MQLVLENARNQHTVTEVAIRPSQVRRRFTRVCVFAFCNSNNLISSNNNK